MFNVATPRNKIFSHLENKTNKTNKKKKNKQEQKLSYMISEYMTLQYPNIIYRFDVAADIRLTIGQAKLVKTKLKHKRGFPDLMIFYPTESFHGLFLELKKSKDEIYTKSGVLRKSEHIQEQMKQLEKLNSLGYYATFACGFDETKDIIDNYINNNVDFLIKKLQKWGG